MQINPVSVFNNKPLSFARGKTFIYTDFDGTYFPYSHVEGCCDKTESQRKTLAETMCEFYSKIKAFLKDSKGKASITITTGRSFAEYDYVMKKICAQNFSYQNPKALIASDGCAFFENKGQMVANKKAKDFIFEQTGFDGEKISADLKQIIGEVEPKAFVVDALVNKHEVDYGEDSLEYKLKNIQDDRKRNFASFSLESKTVIEVVLSETLDADAIVDSFNEYLEENNISATVQFCPNFTYAKLPHYFENGEYKLKPTNLIFIRPNIDGEALGKPFAIKEEIRKTIAEGSDDLVVALGDGFNDEKMLNPLTYLDVMGVELDENLSLKENLLNHEIKNALLNLPFVSVIMGSDESLNSLREMKEVLDSEGIYKIILEKDSKSNYVTALNKAIFEYSKVNLKYKNALPKKTYETIVNMG